ncbi:MAG: hypothetical protein UV68_C0072G0007 [Candidatus Collierbacteria bacterium GW2011_GWC2_43_12]|uniref:DksA C4-type domain-containing protein n=1 Tax=Candidatus Collierbacteria bacterium GW2011_GWC2_43_12 TaxID=1618390 RepID=A0A0G1F859_9BACT|nr:MAG: hypothetical protein UV68_C0072G0007 [Candidatus Collierbacteria bacterium GW2011_GWC2_43_12]
MEETKIKFPLSVLQPLIHYLKGEEKRLKETKKELKKEDPFLVGNRDQDNSVDSDVAENVDHDRTSAMRRQVTRSIIEIRKTLSRIKLGKYGICANCKRMIDTDRLASCETRIEKKRS